MSVKRFIFIFSSGLAIEAAILFGGNYLMHWGMDRINWRSMFVWIFFGAGFLTACWLYLWSKLMTRLFDGKKGQDTSNAVTSGTTHTAMSVQPTASVVQATQPAQAAPITTPTVSETPSNSVQQNTTSTTPSPNIGRPAMPRMAPPIRMAVQSNAILSIDPTNPTTAVPPAPASTPSAPAYHESSSQKKQDILKLAAINPDLDMKDFTDVALAGQPIDLVYSSDDVAVLCRFFSEEHTWHVDTSTSIEECTWTNEISDIIKPCGILLRQKVAVEKMQEGALVIPTIVMIRGVVENYQQVADYLLQNKITLVQYENSGMPELQSLDDLLTQNFTLVTDEDVELDEENESYDDLDVDNITDEQQAGEPRIIDELEPTNEDTSVTEPEEQPNGYKNN